MSAPARDRWTVTLHAWGEPVRDELSALRFEVFCEEQKVPRELELDEIDAIAVHAAARRGDGAVEATGRLFPQPGEPGAARIGRMAVRASARGAGAGMAVLAALLREGLAQGYAAFRLDAQTHAIGFYERAGFQVVGPEHWDAGILHREMELQAGDARRMYAPPGA